MGQIDITLSQKKSPSIIIIYWVICPYKTKGHRIMTYDYVKIGNDVFVRHYIRLDKLPFEIANSVLFKEMVEKENGDGQIILLIRRSNGLYTIQGNGMNLSHKDHELDKLKWEKRIYDYVK